ncbi:MAG: 3-dehydroquinate synthase [Acidobacteria bacterium]|uniref:3-dehydroquinate synthase n=1 Tax=Candidatus Polarisedimenticola svalbardensis TaxID=2886004 RepID=A0A8J6XQV2_9BACT|nr:3-dehydroquinate synthase [Candidatus Polarisedimenticola svalbardensis]
MRTIEIRSGLPVESICPVHLGPDAPGRLVQDLARAGYGRTVLISDSNVAPLHADQLTAAAAAAGVQTDLLTFPAGERFKTRETKADIEDRLANLKVGRDGAIVALGGGVTGDLAGFVAATWSRGIPVYQVPTSLLAMADAAIGGKTALDLPGAKNRIGAFHTPEGVYIDPSYLKTLPADRFTSGLAEVVKYGVIADPGILSVLEERFQAVREPDSPVLLDLLVSCVRIKAAVVQEDPLEAGRRAVLNFGHTVAHALEAVSGYDIDHGEAVAVGMVVEGRLAADITGFPGEELERLEQCLVHAGLPVKLPQGFDPAEILEAAGADKKNREGRIRCALPVRLGEMIPGPDPTVAVNLPSLRAALAAD